jgi:hypothetical protein
MAAEQQKDNSNKLRDGPCAEHYFELEKCAAEKNITSSHMVSLRYELIVLPENRLKQNVSP